MDPTRIPAQIVDAFRCPLCSASVIPEPDGLRCRSAGHLTPWSHGYLDARGSEASGDNETELTFDHFGYEWTQFSSINPEDEVFWRRYFADVDLSALGGRLGLDAGCGKGRFSSFTAPYLGALVASDGSRATEAAAANLSDRPNTCVLRADLRTMPFVDGAFGFISCLGVLHHLADPDAGMESLARMLAPSGLMLVYLYSRPEQAGIRYFALKSATALRRVTVKMPLAALRLLCWPLAAALYGGIVLPGSVGARARIGRLATLPLATYRGSPLRSLWLDTFDRLSAPLEARFTPEEVASLFVRHGLEVHALRTDPQLAGIVALGGKRPI
jgi:SAM-dependent methyltransferase